MVVQGLPPSLIDLGEFGGPHFASRFAGRQPLGSPSDFAQLQPPGCRLGCHGPRHLGTFAAAKDDGPAGRSTTRARVQSCPGDRRGARERVEAVLSAFGTFEPQMAALHRTNVVRFISKKMDRDEDLVITTSLIWATFFSTIWCGLEIDHTCPSCSQTARD